MRMIILVIQVFVGVKYRGQAAGPKEKQAGSRAGRRWIDWCQMGMLALHPDKPLDRQVSSENAFEHTWNARGSKSHGKPDKNAYEYNKKLICPIIIVTPGLHGVQKTTGCYSRQEMIRIHRFVNTYIERTWRLSRYDLRPCLYIYIYVLGTILCVSD